jgi:DNA invertase Pin-like site-specific DNA recombinase
MPRSLVQARSDIHSRRGGRPLAVDEDVLAVARARQSRGESVTAIARHLKIGRSTLYRALQPGEEDLASAAAEPGR